MRALTRIGCSALVFTCAAVADSPSVDLVRVPGGGLQPEIAVDDTGTVHMVYLAGEPGRADAFYIRSTDGARTFSRPVRVNSQPGSAIALGTIRGAQVAVGRQGRVHVAWNGSDGALPRPAVHPKAGDAGPPMLYARSNLAGTAFELQRNLITETRHLDGGGTVAADRDGGVYVAWHAHPADGEGGEEARRVWIARSLDDGETFGTEVAVSDPSTGVCSCCALRVAATPEHGLHLLYRSATGTIHRDIYALVSRDRGLTFSGTRLHGWEIGACPMSSSAITRGRSLLRTWETGGQVYFASIEADASPIAPPLGPDDTPNRKHPRLAVGSDGSVLLVWTEGTSFGRGGSLAWQAFDTDGRPTAVRGARSGLPAWSFAAVVARPDGGFTILY